MAAPPYQFPPPPYSFAPIHVESSPTPRPRRRARQEEEDAPSPLAVVTSRPHKRSCRQEEEEARSSSPPLAEDHISLDEFCERYSLSEESKKRLTSLEFSVGQSVDCVSCKEWEGVGFRELSWKRVMKACNSYRRNHEGL